MIDAIADETDDDPYDYVRPPGPSPREVRKRWVEEGDVEAFLDLIRNKPWSSFSIAEQLRNLQRACEVRAMKDPAAFAGDMFARIVAFNSFLVLRCQLVVADRVVGRGELPSTPAHRRPLERRGRSAPAPPDGDAGRRAEVLVAQAKAARVWSLIRAKEAQAEPAAPAAREVATPAPFVGRRAGPIRGARPLKRMPRSGRRCPAPRPGADAVGDGRTNPDARDLERRWAGIQGRMEAASEVLARRGSIASRLTSGGTRGLLGPISRTGLEAAAGNLPGPRRRAGAPGPRLDRGLPRT